MKIPTPVGANQQLWALSTYKGRLYLGYVDTGGATWPVRRRPPG